MKNFGLVLGDLAALAALTLAGFATHGETDLNFAPRMASTFFPLLAGWFLAAPALGLYRAEATRSWRGAGLAALAMLLAGPLAVLLRALWLNTVVIPVFGLVLSGTGALTMAVWRGLYAAIQIKKAS